ncbi:MAG: hypothetical protein J5940_06685 [Clostridia bacterium]|nr:hypothetical protein [Clostridia bacterium]
MKYSEKRTDSKKYKEEYQNGIIDLIKQRNEDAGKAREEYIKNVFTEPEKYRRDLEKMLGWPLDGGQPYSNAEPPAIVYSEPLDADDGHELCRIQAEVLPGVRAEGLFYKSKAEGKMPLVVVCHGGLGDPELIGGFFGSTSNYNDMLQRVKRYGVHVFAPLMFVWNGEKSGVNIDRAGTDAALRRVGGSITAVEVFSIKRWIDLFVSKPYVSDVGMVGLSYGGFYTLMTAALDTRIKSAISCSFFNTGERYHNPDRAFRGAAYTFDDAEVAALVYPRRLCIEVGEKDELFDVAFAERSFERLKRICAGVGTEWVDFVKFGGGHEFCRDDTPVERLIGDLDSQIISGFASSARILRK